MLTTRWSTTIPNVIDAWFNLGNAALQGRPLRGGDRRTSSKALELKPDYDLAVINMANAYRKLGEDDAALAGYEHYLTIDPKNAHVRYQIGEIYLDRGDEAQGRSRTSDGAGDRSARRRRRATRSASLAFQRGDLARRGARRSAPPSR